MKRLAVAAAAAVNAPTESEQSAWVWTGGIAFLVLQSRLEGLASNLWVLPSR